MIIGRCDGLRGQPLYNAEHEARDLRLFRRRISHDHGFPRSGI